MRYRMAYLRLKTIMVSAIVLLFAAFAAAEVIDKIAVVVNDEVITLSEIDETLRPVYDRYRLIYQEEDLAKKLEEARQKIIEQLVDQKLLVSAAKKDKTEVLPEEVEERIEELKKRLGTKENFDSALKNDNITLKELKIRYKEQVMVKKFIDKNVISKITLSPVEVKNYYDMHTDEFSEPETVRLSNILIKLKDDPAAIKMDAETAKAILNKIKEGEDFAALAKQYSEGPGAEAGGDMGYVRKGDLMGEIDSVVFSMKPGEVSGIVQTSLGYHIFKVEEKTPARMKTFDEVRSDIEDHMFRYKIDEGVKDTVRKLRKNAYISFK